jgi:glutamate--cysteine ligase
VATELREAVPHLTTALTGALLELEAHLLAAETRIEQWFHAEWLKTPPPVYGSVDLRNSGFKLAPVDTNLFPAGFNNLNPAFLPLCTQAINAALTSRCRTACRVLVIAESHTRNLFYFESLGVLTQIIARAGFEVRIGSLRTDLAGQETVELTSGGRLVIEPVQRQGSRAGIGDFNPCVVLLNNDLSAGRPAILEDIEQPILPPLDLGWSQRRKSAHFAHYSRVAGEFASIVDIDHWLVDPMFRQCGKIDFQKREGEECLMRNVDLLLEDIQANYTRYGIKLPPFVIVKADAGTYGMNIMTVRSPDDVRELNRKQRNKMAVGKEGRPVTEALVQEGVYTFETIGPDAAVAEPVVYMIDRFVVGGFYRVHKSRGPDENLNAPGMHFEALAFEQPCTAPDSEQAPDAPPNRFYAYGVVARLALLAAAREIADARAAR